MKIRVGMYDVEFTAKETIFPRDGDEDTRAFANGIAFMLFQLAEKYNNEGYYALARNYIEDAKGVAKAVREAGGYSKSAD